MGPAVNPTTALFTRRLEAIQSGMDAGRADAFLDDLLRLGGQGDEVTCEVVENRVIRVVGAHEALCEVALPLAKIKFRSLCSRLAERCGAWPGESVLQADGESFLVEHPETRREMTVQVVNSPSRQRISIRPGVVAVLPTREIEESPPKKVFIMDAGPDKMEEGYADRELIKEETRVVLPDRKK